MTPEEYEILFGEPMPIEEGPPTTAPQPPPPPASPNPPPPKGNLQSEKLSYQPPPPVAPSSQQTRFAALRRKRVAIPLGVVAAFIAIGEFSDSPDDELQSAEGEAVIETEVEGIQLDDVTSTTEAPTTTTTTTTSLPQTQEQSSFAPVSEAELASTVRQLEEANVVSSFVGFTSYDRDTYDGGGWPDTDGDCQSDRHEVLIEESLFEPVLNGEGCRVETGLWVDPYDGTEYTNASAVSIDHFIPLGHAHRAGAWQWDEPTRRAFASDISFPATHAAVGQEINQAKADRGPDEWRPPLQDSWCRYAVDWTAVKTRWELAFTEAEVVALAEMLDTCTPVSDDGTTSSTTAPPASPSTTTPQSSTTTEPSTQDESVEAQPTGAVIEISWCRVRDETVQLLNTGTELITLNGWVLHDETRNHEVELSRITLDPGQRVVMLSGEDTLDVPETFRWADRNVWNNDGDTATLLNSSGQVVAQERCT